MRKIQAIPIVFILFFALGTKAQSQNSILEKKVTLNYSSVTIEEVLKNITQQTGILFQFSNNNLDPDKKINIGINNGTLKDALDYLFKGTDIKYAEFQNQILLSKSTGNKKFTISGYVNEKGSKELLVGVPIYIPEIKNGTTANAFGFYSIT